MSDDAQQLRDPPAEPVPAVLLKEGSVYFALNYIDTAMLIPTMETVVFIGRDLESGDTGQVYFQDIESYQRGVRFNDSSEQLGPARFYSGSEDSICHIFEYEQALVQLSACLQRRRRSQHEPINP